MLFYKMTNICARLRSDDELFPRPPTFPVQFELMDGDDFLLMSGENFELMERE
jgi:hypothetical protein